MVLVLRWKLFLLVLIWSILEQSDFFVFMFLWQSIYVWSKNLNFFYRNISMIQNQYSRYMSCFSKYGFFWVKCDLWEIIFLWIEILINFKIKKILIRKITLFVYIFKYIMNLCIKINILRIFRKSIIVKIYIKLVTVEMIDVLRFYMIYLPFSYSFESLRMHLESN